jgi:TDG/mug DNA glycosylase family protein
MKTLPDYLREGLDLVSIGINPSTYSVEKGFYFARPQNRFWKALAASGLAGGELVPGVAAMEVLFRERGIGFTDVVKRPSSNAAALRDADWERWAPVLRRKLLRHAPRIAWFHGRAAWEGYLRFAESEPCEFTWGRQARRIGRSIVFVTPNPSGANAGHSLADLVRWYRRLARLRGRS